MVKAAAVELTSASGWPTFAAPRIGRALSRRIVSLQQHVGRIRPGSQILASYAREVSGRAPRSPDLCRPHQKLFRFCLGLDRMPIGAVFNSDGATG
jgi:hypothetical protein